MGHGKHNLWKDNFYLEAEMKILYRIIPLIFLLALFPLKTFAANESEINIEAPYAILMEKEILRAKIKAQRKQLTKEEITEKRVGGFGSTVK